MPRGSGRCTMNRRWVDAATALLLGLLWVSPTGAAALVVAGQDGTHDAPHPTEGATTEEDWNPIVTCTLPAGGSIEDLLDCLLDRVATPPPCFPGGSKDCESRQDFIVTLLPLPEYGVDIRRLDGSEIDRI